MQSSFESTLSLLGWVKRERARSEKVVRTLKSSLGILGLVLSWEACFLKKNSNLLFSTVSLPKRVGAQKKREPLRLSLSHFFLCCLSEVLFKFIEESVKVFEYCLWRNPEFPFAGRAGKEEV